MTTTLFLQKFAPPEPGKKLGKFLARREVEVPRCPMFDFNNQNDTEEVKALLADGFRITGHRDHI